MAGEPTDGPDEDRHLTASQRFIARCRMTFRARWWLVLLPVIGITAYGAKEAVAQEDTYRSEATLSVADQSYIGQLSELRTVGSSYDSVAVRLSREFNGLMATDQFPRTIAEKAGLTAELAADEQYVLDFVRRSVYATSVGDSLIKVIVVTTEPVTTFNIASSAVNEYRAWVLSSEVAASKSAETFYDSQLAGLQDAIDSASNALDTYLTEHPAPADDADRDISEQLQIQSLNGQLERAQDRYDAAVDKRDEAKLASAQSDADIAQRIQVVDQPEQAFAPEASFKKKATTVVLFGFIGILAAISVLAALTVLDRTVRDESDLQWLKVPTLGAIPREPLAHRSLSGVRLGKVQGKAMRAAG